MIEPYVAAARARLGETELTATPSILAPASRRWDIPMGIGRFSSVL
jgi:hypothetical protein